VNITFLYTYSQFNTSRRKSLLDETSNSKAVPSDVLDGKSSSLAKTPVERTASGSTTMSANAVVGETREERIAR